MADTKLENMTETTAPALTDLVYLVRPGAPSVDRRTTLANLHKILGGVTDITYANLVSEIGGATLTPGTLYRITDYATKHYIIDGDGTWYNTIITGTTEPLIVLATSTSTIDKQAYSPANPEDVIYYDWNPANWMDDLSFVDDPSGTPPVIVTGFKGVITFRHDTLLDNYAGFDFRECKFRRWKTDVAAWDNLTAYTAGDYVTHDTKIWKALQNSTGKDPTSQAAYWFTIIDLTNFEYWNAAPGTWNGIDTNDAVYDDFKLFVEGSGSATYELCCRANHFSGFRDTSSFNETTGSILPNNIIILTDASYYTCYSNNISSAFYGNTIGDSFYSNDISSGFYQNVIGYYFTKNTIGEYFKTNIIGQSFNGNSINGSFSQNYIGDEFDSNVCGFDFLSNSISKSFAGNVIGIGFSNNIIGKSFAKNIIGDGFANNNIGQTFNFNQVGSTFSTNIIGNGFIRNVIGSTIGNNTILANFQMNIVDSYSLVSVDLSAGNHVYAAYTCEIFKRSGGTARLRYTDGSDVLTVVAPNA